MKLCLGLRFNVFQFVTGGRDSRVLAMKILWLYSLDFIELASLLD